MSDIKKTIETLEAYNRWRRDDNNEYELVYTSKELGLAIDDACEKLKVLVELTKN